MALKTIVPKEIQRALIAGVACFLFFLFVGGKYMYKVSISKLIDYKNKRIRVQLENDVGKELEKMKKMRDKVKTVKETSRFLAEIAKIAGQLNVKLKSISAMPVEKYPEYVRLSVNFEVQATYHELGMFISKLEDAELFVSIDKLQVTAFIEKGADFSPLVNAKIVATTFSITETLLEK